MADLVLVLGGTRSGKSRVAELLVEDDPQVTYIATSSVDDEEMARRVKIHQERRPASWTTVETTDLAGGVEQSNGAVLIDGVGAWLAAVMSQRSMFDDAGNQPAPDVNRDVEALLASIRGHGGGPVVVVAEEVGMSVVPTDPGTRLWVDLLGTTVQRLSAAAQRVVLVHAGRMIDLPHRPPAAAPAPSVSLRSHGDTMVGAGALDFAVNVHGDGPPEHLRAVLAAASANTGQYPDPTAARAAVAARHGRDPDDVLITAGAAEAFWLLASVVAARHAVVVHPQFTEPEAALLASGVPVTPVLRSADSDWALQPHDVPPDADLVVVGAPNNPTGNLEAPDALAALCRPGRVTIVDEAFIDFVAEPDAGLAARADLPGLVVVRSVTKLWGLAGLRAGYMVGPAGLLRRCSTVRQPWAVSTPALRAVEVCAADEAYRVRVAETTAQERIFLLDRLREVPGVTAWDSAANFVLLRVADGARIHRRLAAAGIAVRPSTFPGLSSDHLRVAVRSPAMTLRLVEALSAAIEEDDA